VRTASSRPGRPPRLVGEAGVRQHELPLQGVHRPVDVPLLGPREQAELAPGRRPSERERSLGQLELEPVEAGLAEVVGPAGSPRQRVDRADECRRDEGGRPRDVQPDAGELPGRQLVLPAPDDLHLRRERDERALLVANRPLERHRAGDRLPQRRQHVVPVGEQEREAHLLQPGRCLLDRPRPHRT
jgi:hypothetical protein